MAICPECDAPLEFDEVDVEAGDAVSCDECGTSLIVTSSSPLELEPADEEEDEEEEDDDEEEEDDLGEDDESSDAEDYD